MALKLSLLILPLCAHAQAPLPPRSWSTPLIPSELIQNATIRSSVLAGSTVVIAFSAPIPPPPAPSPPWTPEQQCRLTAINVNTRTVVWAWENPVVADFNQGENCQLTASADGTTILFTGFSTQSGFLGFAALSVSFRFSGNPPFIWSIPTATGQPSNTGAIQGGLSLPIGLAANTPGGGSDGAFVVNVFNTTSGNSGIVLLDVPTGSTLNSFEYNGGFPSIALNPTRTTVVISSGSSLEAFDVATCLPRFSISLRANSNFLALSATRFSAIATTSSPLTRTVYSISLLSGVEVFATNLVSQVAPFSLQAVEPTGLAMLTPSSLSMLSFSTGAVMWTWTPPDGNIYTTPTLSSDGASIIIANGCISTSANSPTCRGGSANTGAQVFLLSVSSGSVTSSFSTRFSFLFPVPADFVSLPQGVILTSSSIVSVSLDAEISTLNAFAAFSTGGSALWEIPISASPSPLPVARDLVALSRDGSVGYLVQTDRVGESSFASTFVAYSLPGPPPPEPPIAAIVGGVLGALLFVALIVTVYLKRLAIVACLFPRGAPAWLPACLSASPASSSSAVNKSGAWSAVTVVNPVPPPSSYSVPPPSYPGAPAYPGPPPSFNAPPPPQQYAAPPGYMVEAAPPPRM